MRKNFLIGLCALVGAFSATLGACSVEANEKLSTVAVSYGESLNVKSLFGEKDTFESARLTDEAGKRIVLFSDTITMTTLGKYTLQLKGGYHEIIVADTTAPKATAVMYNTGVGEQAEIVLNVFDNMDKTVENVSYKLYYGEEEIALTEEMTFVPQAVGAYRFDVSATDLTGNSDKYSFTFTVDVDTDILVDAGTMITVSDALFDGVVDDKTAYDFSYEITKNGMNIEKVISENSFTVDNSAVYKVNAIAVEKANADNKIVVPYTYHTDNIAHAHFLGEQANTSAFLVNDAMGLYHGIGLQENGRKSFDFGFTGAKIDSRAYLTIGGFEPNTTYEYMSFDLTAKAPKDGSLIIALYPTQEMGKKQEYIAVTNVGTRRVIAKDQTTDENGVLRLFAYFFQTMDISITNLQLYKTADMTATITLNGYAFSVNPGGAQMEADAYSDKLVTSWFSEPTGGDRPGWSISGLEAGELYDVSIDVESNLDVYENGNPDVNTVFYYSDTARGDDHYGFLTENKGETKRTFVFPQLVADENGVVYYDGLYIKNGVVDTWTNLKVSKHNTATTTYETGETATTARFELLNSAERQERVHPYVSADGKLGVDIGKGALGNMQGARPQLVISGLKAGKVYDVIVKAEISGRAPLVAPFYTQTSKGNDHYGVYTEAGNAEWSSKFEADANGEIVFGAWYIGAWVQVVFTEITAVEELPPMGKYGEVKAWLEIVNHVCDAATTSLNGTNYVIQPAKANSSQSGLGNDRKNNKGAALTFSGLQANTSYTIDVTFELSFATADKTKALMIFTKDGSNTTGSGGSNCFEFVQGTTAMRVDANKSAIGKVNAGDYGAGTYVLRLSGTTDETGTVAFGGWYFTDVQAIVEITGVNATAK